MLMINELRQKVSGEKNRRNNFGNYNYRNAEDLLKQIKPLLTDDDRFIINYDIHSSDYGDYIKCFVQFNDYCTQAFARIDQSKKGMDAPQMTGSAITYATKYALSALLLLDDSELDPDNENKEKVRRPVSKKVLAYKARLQKLGLDYEVDETKSEEQMLNEMISIAKGYNNE